MIIQTSRFGQVEIQDSDVLFFQEGLLGFADLRKFVLLDDPNDEIFAWLQSCESAAIAFPVLDPELFSESYKIGLTKADMEALKLAPDNVPRQLCIITIPDDPTQMTANLKAPVVVNLRDRIARQCVLQENQLAIREPIFMKLQERVVRNPSMSIKSQTPAMDVAVRLAPHSAATKAEPEAGAL